MRQQKKSSKTGPSLSADDQGRSSFHNAWCKKLNIPQSSMVWSAVSVKLKLYTVQNTMRQYQYLEVLEKRLITQLHAWYSDGNCVFMQDSASCYTANSVKRFFSERDLEVLQWPLNNSDMNPIEGIWNDLKKKVNKTVISNKTQLIECLTRVRESWSWNSFTDREAYWQYAKQNFGTHQSQSRTY